MYVLFYKLDGKIVYFNLLLYKWKIYHGKIFGQYGDLKEIANEQYI